MSKKDKCPECKAGLPEWMATYGDLVTLLMCFFVLLFAFSEIDAQKFEAVMESFQGSAGILSGGTTISQENLIFEATPEVTTSETSPVTEDIQQLKEQIEAYLEDNKEKNQNQSQDNIEQDIIVEIDTRGLIIRFPDKALFDSGKADLKRESMDTLDFLGGLLNSDEFNMMAIRVEGHTDNVPINTFRFPSNWELSTTRATNVLKYFINEAKMNPQRLAASGYGEYYPIEDNATREGRSKNRRVDIVILSKHFESVEPTSN
ncbi:MAG: flagellar motor protein MotB [Clostridia bacterium]|nr:flagellar motor protein MotB [Clostridia bacterium]